MSLADVIVDVLADTPLQENKLAVSENGSALSDDQMQHLTRETNLPETVFLLPDEDGDDADATRRRRIAAARYSGGSAAGAQTRALSRPLLPSDFRPPARPPSRAPGPPVWTRCPASRPPTARRRAWPGRLPGSRSGAGEVEWHYLAGAEESAARRGYLGAPERDLVYDGPGLRGTRVPREDSP
jgi:hypothetical protein